MKQYDNFYSIYLLLEVRSDWLPVCRSSGQKEWEVATDLEKQKLLRKTLEAVWLDNGRVAAIRSSPILTISHNTQWALGMIPNAHL